MRNEIKILTIFIIILKCSSLTVYSQNSDSLWRLRFDTLSFSQKLNCISKESNPAFKVTFSNVDSTNNTVDIKLSFYFSKKAIRIMQADFMQKDSLNLKNEKSKINHQNNATFLLKNVKIHWDDYTHGYISNNPMVLYQLNDIRFNRNVDGVIQLRRNIWGGGWEINFIILNDYDFDNQFYYFNYKTNLLQAISSNENFNTIIRDTRLGRRHIRSTKTRPPFIYIISNLLKKKVFLRIVDDYHARMNNSKY